MFFDKPKIPHTQLNRKIDKIEDFANDLLSSFRSKAYWQEFRDLAKEVKEDFKNCHYPTKQEREAAWQRFFNARDKAYKEMDRLFKLQSAEHRQTLFGKLRGLGFNMIVDDTIGTLLLDRETIESMKKKGRWLKEAGQYFSSVKHEMTKEHKAEVFAQIIKIREQQNRFWELNKASYADRKKENDAQWQKVQEARRKAWEEKQEKSRRVRERIENNLAKNKERLSKAQNFLYKLEDQRRKLQSDIWDSNTPGWKSKAEDWLREKEDKIRDVQGQIENYKDWIREGQDKLNSWN